MEAKKPNKDKIYVYSSFKQFCCSWVSSAVAMHNSVMKCYYKQ